MLNCSLEKGGVAASQPSHRPSRLPEVAVPPRTLKHLLLPNVMKLAANPNVSFGKGVDVLHGERINSVPRAVLLFGTFTHWSVLLRRMRLSPSKKSQSCVE